jgi:hypothetical protein
VTRFPPTSPALDNGLALAAEAVPAGASSKFKDEGAQDDSGRRRPVVLGIPLEPESLVQTPSAGFQAGSD